MAWTQNEIEACIESCRKKAAVDAEFRRKLLADPAAAVKEVSGKEIPAGFKIRILENDPAYDATFVLPPLVSETSPTASLTKSPPASAACRPVRWTPAA
ncbi:MAG: hypothetical protein V8T86_01690 [Victivallis sp.]